MKYYLTREGFPLNLSKRIKEDEEVISGEEAKKYAYRKDDRSLTFDMVAFDIIERTKIDKHSKILEVCCGAGQLASSLYKLTENQNIVATEGSPELIKAAREKYKEMPIKFEVQNIHNHEAKNNFDVVICKDSFHHFEDPVASLKDLLSLAKENGLIYVWDLCRSTTVGQASDRSKLIESEHEGKRFLASLNASFTIKEMENIIQEADAKKIEIVYPFKFSNKNIEEHKSQIESSKVKENDFGKLFAIYVIKKGKYQTPT